METNMQLQADAFNKFLASWEIYGPDATLFYITQGLAWQATRKTIGVGLELLTDQAIYLLMERCLRRGVAMISKR